jgi:hypothetical protein
MSIFIAVIILVIVGGGIAYLGDRIGSTVGKKRLSVLKLRPRDTARLFTVSSGALIALITFLLLALIDHGFLVALQRGAELIRSNVELSKANKALVYESQKTEQQLTNAVGDRLQAEGQLSAVNQQLLHAKAQTSQEQGALKTVQGKLSIDQAQVTTLEHHAKLLTIANAEAESRLNKTVAKVQTGIIGTLIYRSDEEVGRCTIDSGQPLVTTRQAIYTFLSQLNQDAIDRGGKGVQLFKFGYAKVVVGDRENVDALAQSIHEGRSGRVAVIAKALGNAYAGEPVIVILHPYADRLALPAGTALAQLTIPTTDSQNPARVLSDLQGLLAIARSSAIRAGVIPLENPQIRKVEVGDVYMSELYEVYDQVRLSNGPAVVIISTAKDTYASDHPVALKFSVNGNDVHQDY